MDWWIDESLPSPIKDDFYTLGTLISYGVPINPNINLAENIIVPPSSSTAKGNDSLTLNWSFGIQ